MRSSPQKSVSQLHTASAERLPERDVAVSSESGSGIDAMHVLHGEAGNYAVARALSAGVPLAADIRAEMEARFGANFADVRIHNDEQAHASAALMNAKAYTHGDDIVFNADRFAPHSSAGKRLLAHELAHVIQQNRGGGLVSGPSQQQSIETQANAAATSIMQRGGPVFVGGATAPSIAREVEDDFEAEDEIKRQERRLQRTRGKAITQQREQERQHARGGIQETGNDRARREINMMMEEVRSGRLAQLSRDAKLTRLRQFKQVLKDVRLPQIQKNRLQGQYYELLRTLEPQTKWVAGGEALPFMKLPPGKASYTQPDESKGRDVHVNFKSDTLEGITPAQARAKGKAYAAQAQRNAAHLPTIKTPGAPSGKPQYTSAAIIVDFAEPGSPEVRQEILKQLFSKKSPVREVRFHTITVLREDWELLDKERRSIAKRTQAATVRSAKKPQKTASTRSRAKSIKVAAKASASAQPVVNKAPPAKPALNPKASTPSSPAPPTPTQTPPNEASNVPTEAGRISSPEPNQTSKLPLPPSKGATIANAAPTQTAPAPTVSETETARTKPPLPPSSAPPQPNVPEAITQTGASVKVPKVPVPKRVVTPRIPVGRTIGQYGGAFASAIGGAIVNFTMQHYVQEHVQELANEDYQRNLRETWTKVQRLCETQREYIEELEATGASVFVNVTIEVSEYGGVPTPVYPDPFAPPTMPSPASGLILLGYETKKIELTTKKLEKVQQQDIHMGFLESFKEAMNPKRPVSLITLSLSYPDFEMASLFEDKH